MLSNRPCRPHHHPHSYTADAEWLDALVAVVQPRLAAYPARDIAALLSSLARLSYSPPTAFLGAALQRFAAVLPDAQPQHLCNVAGALGAFWQRHADHQWLFNNVGCVDALAAAALRQLPAFNAFDLEQLLLAFARMGYYPEREWLQAHEARALELGPRPGEGVLGPAALCKLAAAYTELSHEPGQAFAEAARRARAEVEREREVAAAAEAAAAAAAAAGGEEQQGAAEGLGAAASAAAA
jgi:hypothetical protein